MVILDADFSEGDIFTAGTIASTSGVNGITTTINSNTLTKLLYVESDLTEGSIASSTNETTIGSVTVPAGLVTSGVFVVASLAGGAHAGQTNNVTFKLKTGVSSSEVERESFTLSLITSVQSGGNISWWDDAADYTAEVSVLVTGTNSDSNSNSEAVCHSVVVYGY